MATVTGMTAAAMQAIADASIVSGEINGSNDLILTTHGGTTQDAGHIAVATASTTVPGILELAADSDAVAQTNTSKAVTPHALGAALAYHPTGRRRRNINGNFSINQRGYVSGASFGIGTYSFDRWKASGVVNQIQNPRASVNTTGWNIGPNGGGAATLAQVTTGGPLANCPSFLRATITTAAPPSFYIYNGGNTTVVTPGTLYEVSTYVRCTAAVTVAFNMSEQNAAGTGIGTSANFAATALTANTWTRLSSQYTSSPTAVKSSPQLLTTVGTLPIGATLDSTGWMVTLGGYILAYFDGDTTGCSWSSTAGGSVSYNVPNVIPSLAFTSAPQGQVVTLSANSLIQTVVEQADIIAGVHTLSWVGTASGRVYNRLSSSAPPAFAVSGSTFTLDGTDDVVVEFTTPSGASGSLSQVQLEEGSVATTYEILPKSEELKLCQYYYVRYTGAGQFFFCGPVGTSQSTTTAVFFVPIAMRAIPILSSSNVGWAAGGSSVTGVATLSVSAQNTNTGNPPTGTWVSAAWASAAGSAGMSGYPVVYNVGTGYFDLNADF